jgi:hypothetical protein
MPPSKHAKKAARRVGGFSSRALRPISVIHIVLSAWEEASAASINNHNASSTSFVWLSTGPTERAGLVPGGYDGALAVHNALRC